MKRICALTMVRDDEFFLRKWVDYYGSRLGEENLYVYFDGTDQVVPDFCRDVNTLVCPRVNGDVARADRGRIDFLSEEARVLLETYDMVIGTDVDEFLLVDPSVGMSLAEYLSSLDVKVAVSALGVDVGQNVTCEVEIDDTRPFLEQRRFGYLSPRYTKSSVIATPVRWGSGFHRVRDHNFHIDPHLYLFHFGCIDRKMLQARTEYGDRLAHGWSRHLKKRARTITIVSEAKARKWDRTMSHVRRLQTLLRPVFAWNKPSLWGAKIVVEIPPRFSREV